MNRVQPQILMVDDDPDECENMSDILGDQGYRVDTAATGHAALRLADQQAYELALLDLKMPDMDGVTLSRELIRRRPETVALLVTGYPEDVTLAEAFAAGIRQVVSKPVDVRRFLTTINSLMRLQSSQTTGPGAR